MEGSDTDVDEFETAVAPTTVAPTTGEFDTAVAPTTDVCIKEAVVSTGSPRRDDDGRRRQDATILDICTGARGDGMDEEDESREAECAPKGEGDDYLCAVVDAVHVVAVNAAETAIEPWAAAEAFASAVSPCAESPAALAAFGADGVNQYVDAGVPWLAQAFPSAPVEKLHRALNLLWSPIARQRQFSLARRRSRQQLQSSRASRTP